MGAGNGMYPNDDCRREMDDKIMTTNEVRETLGLGMMPAPSPSVHDLGEPGMFVSDDHLIINWLGENYYKACDRLVKNFDDGGASHCVKRVFHPNDCEDYDGRTRPRG